MKFLKIFIGIIVSLYLLLGAYLYIHQRDYMYFPTAEIPHAFQTERLAINSESINVVVANAGRSDAIIYFGGNGETVASRAEDFAKTFPKHTIYLVNYRGYGGSTGTPTEKDLYSDASAIYDVVSKRHAHTSVIGRSIGTGVATYVASVKPVYKLALVTPFDSAEHIAQDSYPIYPMSLMLLDKYNSFDRVNKITAPTLIILAENDAVIPLMYSKRLIDQFPASQVEVTAIKNVGHNDIQNSASYMPLLKQFM